MIRGLSKGSSDFGGTRLFEQPFNTVDLRFNIIFIKVLAYKSA
jgi:hypothetical protein